MMGVLIRQHSILGHLSQALATTSVESQMLRAPADLIREPQTPNQVLIAELAACTMGWHGDAEARPVWMAAERCARQI